MATTNKIILEISIEIAKPSLEYFLLCNTLTILRLVEPRRSGLPKQKIRLEGPACYAVETRSAARKLAGLMVCIIRSTAAEGARSRGVVPPCHWRSSAAECAVCSTTSMLAWNGSLETARVFDQAGGVAA